MAARDHAPTTCAATPKSAAVILGAIRKGFRFVLMDHARLTFSALPCGLLGASYAATHNLPAAAGWTLASLHSVFCHLEARSRDWWMVRARDAGAKLDLVLDAAIIRRVDGSTQPFREWASSAEGVAAPVHPPIREAK